MTPSRDIGRLIDIMAALRTPKTGCPWDLAQNFATIAPYTLEEAYEVADAIARDDMADLKDELGDLLLQVVYHARMAEERGAFAFGDVVQAITEKMIRRHPHVFGDMAGALQEHGPQAVAGLWERIKAEEKQRKAGDHAGAEKGALAGVPVALPALTRALKLQAKASKVGFDWNDPRAVLKKIREEADEIEAELDNAPDEAAAEVGDLAVRRGQSRAAFARRSRSGVARRPTASSSAALRRSSGRSQRKARRRRIQASPKWMRCGTRRKNANKRYFSKPATRGNHSAMSGKNVTARTFASITTMNGGTSRKISDSGVRVRPLMTNSRSPCGGSVSPTIILSTTTMPK